MPRFKIYRFMPPYTSSGKTALPISTNRRGVYLIKENGKLVYVGHSVGISTSSNLRKTIYRHFQQWSENSKTRSGTLYHTTYKTRMKRNRYTVRVVFTNNKDQTLKLERALIIKYNPRDNKLKYETYTLNRHDEKAIEAYETTPVLTGAAPF